MTQYITNGVHEITTNDSIAAAWEYSGKEKKSLSRTLMTATTNENRVLTYYIIQSDGIIRRCDVYTGGFQFAKWWPTISRETTRWAEVAIRRYIYIQKTLYRVEKIERIVFIYTSFVELIFVGLNHTTYNVYYYWKKWQRKSAEKPIAYMYVYVCPSRFLKNDAVRQSMSRDVFFYHHYYSVGTLEISIVKSKKNYST